MKLPLTIGAKVASAIYDADGVPVCIIDSMQEASREEEREMARRIVACVNACEGLPEAALKPRIFMAQAIQAQELIAQRDELLAALEGADKAITAALPHLPADGEAVFCGEWLSEIRAAIARAKGGAA